eukprot:250143_1
MSSELTVIQYIYFCSLGMFLCIVCPISLYYCYKIWQVRQQSFFNKRYPRLTVVAVITFLFWIGICRPIADLPYIIPSLNTSLPIRHPIGMTVPLSIIFVRVWFLFYNYNRGLQLAQKQWHSKICDNIYNSQTNQFWALTKTYLSHNSNTIYYATALYVLIAESSILIAGFIFIDSRIDTIIFGFWMCVSLLSMVIMAFKIRPCRDEAYVHHEFRLLSYGAVLTIIFFILWMVAIPDNIPLQKLCRQITVAIMVTFESYVSSKWVLRRYTKRKNTNFSKKNNRKGITLQQVLQHDDGFELFAVFLIQNFAIENLMFLYQAMMFKSECLKNGFIEQSDIGIILEFGKKTNDGIGIRQVNNM